MKIMKKYQLIRLTVGLLTIVLTISSIWFVSFAFVKGNNKKLVIPLEVNQTSSQLETFTASRLSEYDGVNTSKTYVAIQGLVYDFTNNSAWDEGQHMGLTAGKDQTKAFEKSPHAMSLLSTVPVVGQLIDEKDVQVISTEIISQKKEATPKTALLSVEQLANFDGQNGQAAYIAVSGIVYDVTGNSDWKNGQHSGYQAGQDLTSAFASSPHSASLLSTLPIIGELGEQTAETVKKNVQSETKIVSTPINDPTVFTATSLSSFTGKNGQPAYFAVSGIVYDVTGNSDWKNGQHSGYQAGQVLLQLFITQTFGH